MLPGAIRTRDLQIRNLLLYPTELRGQISSRFGYVQRHRPLWPLSYIKPHAILNLQPLDSFKGAEMDENVLSLIRRQEAVAQYVVIPLNFSSFQNDLS